VDEREWLECNDPHSMLVFLQVKMSDRKLRLLMAACCRRMWHAWSLDTERPAVELAERFADGEADAGAVERFRSGIDWRQPGAAKYAVYSTLFGDDACRVTGGKLGAVVGCLGLLADEVALNSVRRVERSAHCCLIRCLFGNPFHPVTIDPAWLAWNGGLLRQLAEAAYEQRHLPSGQLDPDRLAVLADALEESGCQDQEILGHLRQPEAVHVRGCHVVDLLLAKE
jgi:hypothetical protein